MIFENRNDISSSKLQLISKLLPLDENKIAVIEGRFSGLPREYIAFLRSFGHGPIREAGEPDRFPAHFRILNEPISAITDYYHDDEILCHGAKGDIIIFGVESNGTAYGFDSGDKSRLVRVDSFRIVDHMDFSFDQFIFGVIACYPDFPEEYHEMYWTNYEGDRFTL